MKAKKLKIILALKEENTLYKRAIGDLLIMAQAKKPQGSFDYELKDECLFFLFKELNQLFRKDKGQSIKVKISKI